MPITPKYQMFFYHHSTTTRVLQLVTRLQDTKSVATVAIIGDTVSKTQEHTQHF